MESEEGRANSGKPRRRDVPGVGYAMRLGTDLVVTTMVGAGLGYTADHWLKTGPWFTVVFLLFGAAAGFRNVYRLVNADSAST